MNVQHVVIGRPEEGEYAPFFARYISLIQGPDILGVLHSQSGETTAMLRSLSEKDGEFRYGRDKWSVKQMVGHMCDTERVFAYRAMRIARGDKTPLAGFEQDDYVRFADFDKRTLADLVDEFDAIRKATMFLFRGLEEVAWTREGIANNGAVTVRALAYMIAGHELHHQRLLQEKYFPSRRLSA
jgi:DinB superfamily